MRKTLLFLIICIILFSACSNAGELNVELEQYKEKIEYLQDELSNKDTELKELNDKIIALEKENRSTKFKTIFPSC